MARPYLPAAGHDHFLPLYDPILRLFGFRRALEALVAQAELRPDHRVLDVGCGTGTLLIDVARRFPNLRPTGIDPDPLALGRARAKAVRAGASIVFARAFGDALPFRDASFDRVFSSMMFHHVAREEKPRMLAEIHRVLAPGGRLEFLDLAGGTHGFLAQMVHGRQLSVAAQERLLLRLREAGFSDARRTFDRATLAGRIAACQATA